MSAYHAVVLAAGFGSRFGGAKLTAPFRAGVLVDYAIQAALAAPVEAVTLVVGADPAVAIRGHGLDRVRVIRAADHAAGMGASLRAGIAALPDRAEGALIFLGDMPDVPTNLAVQLIATLRAGADAAVPVFQGRRGHPVGFARAVFPELLRLTGDRGARTVLEAPGRRLTEVEAASAGVLTDVDTPADLKALG